MMFIRVDLARPRRAHDGHELAPLDHSDTPRRASTSTCAQPVGLGDVAQGDDRAWPPARRHARRAAASTCEPCPVAAPAATAATEAAAAPPKKPPPPSPPVPVRAGAGPGAGAADRDRRLDDHVTGREPGGDLGVGVAGQTGGHGLGGLLAVLEHGHRRDPAGGGDRRGRQLEHVVRRTPRSPRRWRSCPT